MKHLSDDKPSTPDPTEPPVGHRIRLVACVSAAAKLEAAEQLAREAHRLLADQLFATDTAVAGAFSAETAIKIARAKLENVLRRLP